MPINPIQLFQGSSNSLLDILNNGNDKITGILDRAIQIGRDNVNNQMKQESDMFGQRATETALAQRRAEGLQQNNEDAQRNARNAYEFDTKFQYGQTRDAVQDQQFGQKFEYGKAQDAIQNQRLSANDIFSQGMQEKNYALNSSNMAADNTRMDLQLKASQDAAAAKSKALQEAAQQTADVLGSSQAVPNDIQSAVGADKFSASSLFPSQAQADNRSKALKLAGNPYANSAQLKIAVDAVQPEGQKPPDQFKIDDQAMQKRNFETSQAKTSLDELRKKAETKIKTTSAFLNPYMKSSDKPPGENADRMAEARVAKGQNWMKDQISAELNSAQSMTRDAFIGRVPAASDQEKQERAELWDLAQEIKRQEQVLLPQDRQGLVAPAATPTAQMTPVQKAQATLDALRK